MTHHYKSMTPEALAYRADHVQDCGSFSDIMRDGEEDERAVTAFFEHEDAELDDGLDGCRWGKVGNLIGVVVEGEPALTREDAREWFGDAWVVGQEASRTDALLYPWG